MKLETMKSIAAARTPGRWFDDMCGDIHTDGVMEYEPALEMDLHKMVVHSRYYIEENHDAKFITLAANTYDKLLALAEAAKQLDVGHHALCNSPLGGSCSCGLALLNSALEALERE